MVPLIKQRQEEAAAAERQRVAEAAAQAAAEAVRIAAEEEAARQEAARVQALSTAPAPVVITDHAALMAAAGIAPGDYQYVEYIVMRESGWRATADNPSSDAYGICQALPASKMASAGDDYMINPVTQLKWCNSYAISRYGSWSGAYQFWGSHSWW